MKRTTALALAAAAMIAMIASPALAQRRVDARKEVGQLMQKLVKANADQSYVIEQQIAAFAADLTYMDDVETELIKILDAKSVRQRRTAARLLRYTISGAAVAPLGKVVGKDRSEDVRMEAVTSLCVLKAEEATGVLRTVGTSDESQRVRAAATAALDVIEDRDGAARKGCRRALQTRLAALN